MIEASRGRIRQLKICRIIGPDDEKLSLFSIRLGIKKKSLHFLVFGFNLPQRFCVRQQTTRRRRRQKRGARCQVGVQYSILQFSFGIMRQHEIKNRFRALVDGLGINFRHSLALNAQVFRVRFLALLVSAPIHRHVAFRGPDRFPRRDFAIVLVYFRILRERLVMMHVKSIEIRPRFVLVEIPQSGLPVNREYVLADGQRQVACFQSQVSRFLQRCHFAAHVSAEFTNVRLVPRLERDDVSLPTFGQVAIRIINVAQVGREMPGVVGVCPVRGDMVHLQHLQPGLALHLERIIVARVRGEFAALRFHFRPRHPVTHAVHAGQLTEVDGGFPLLPRKTPGQPHVNSDG